MRSHFVNDVLVVPLGHNPSGEDLEERVDAPPKSRADRQDIEYGLVVMIVFITHHSEAQEVDEDSFFRMGESGGTRVSSAYQLGWDIIHERYDPERWNIYPFHFSDGDNWSDNVSVKKAPPTQGALVRPILCLWFESASLGHRLGPGQ